MWIRNVRITQHSGALAKPLLPWKRNNYYTFWVCVCVCNPSYPACKAHAPYCIVMWPVWLYHIYSRYFIKSMIFGKRKLLNIKCVLWFSLQLLPETFLISRIQRDSILNVHTSSCKNTRYSCQILIKLEFFQQIFFKILKYQISWKSVHWSRVVPCGRTDGRTRRETDGYNEANSRFSQFCECAWKEY